MKQLHMSRYCVPNPFKQTELQLQSAISHSPMVLCGRWSHPMYGSHPLTHSNYNISSHCVADVQHRGLLLGLFIWDIVNLNWLEGS